MNITILGFGEAGPVFAEAMKSAGFEVKAFDRLQLDPDFAQAQIEKTVSSGIAAAENLQMAMQDAELVISTVTASEAVEAAADAQNYMQTGAHWLDLNSVSPDSKLRIYECLAAKGIGFTEGVAMDTVPSKGIKVPLLLCGPEATTWSEQLNRCGLNTRVVGAEYGQASSTKMLRSVVIKGMESLFAESMEAAGRAGVVSEVVNSLQATYPQLNWEELIGYQLSRSVLHAQRRAAEMREAAALVKSLGVNAPMTNATVSKQQELADRGLSRGVTVASVDDFIRVTSE